MNEKLQFDAEQYILQVRRLLDLKFAPDSLAKTVKNLETLAQIAAKVNYFSLPDTLESALEFKPRA